jgi:hypothetical protein
MAFKSVTEAAVLATLLLLLGCSALQRSRHLSMQLGLRHDLTVCTDTTITRVPTCPILMEHVLTSS